MDEYKKMEDTEIPPNRYLVVVADAMGGMIERKSMNMGIRASR